MVQCFAEYNKNYHKFIEVSELFACLFFFFFLLYTPFITLSNPNVRWENSCGNNSALLEYIYSVYCMYVYLYIYKFASTYAYNIPLVAFTNRSLNDKITFFHTKYILSVSFPFYFARFPYFCSSFICWFAICTSFPLSCYFFIHPKTSLM